MAKYHISEDGNPRICRASKNPCKFGGDHAHYATREEARDAYEVTQAALANMEQERVNEAQTLDELQALEKIMIREWADREGSQAERDRFMDTINARWRDIKKAERKAVTDTRSAPDELPENWDYDLEEMGVMKRMKETLKRKHGWENSDFEGMTFTDIESEFLDTYGEEDFRPTAIQADQEYMTYSQIEDAEMALKYSQPFKPEFKADLEKLLSELEENEDWMSHKPYSKNLLRDRLKKVLEDHAEG